METMFGYDKGDMVGMNVSSLCPDPHSQQHDAYVEHYLETGTSHVLDRFEHFDGLLASSFDCNCWCWLGTQHRGRVSDSVPYFFPSLSLPLLSL